MNHLDQQKALFFKKLSKHPILDNFYSQMFINRCARPGWFVNEFVQLLIGDCEPNISLIEKRVNIIGQCDENLLKAIRGSLTGAEADFDKQLHDQLAELHAVQCLIKWLFSRIRKIPRSNCKDRKTPDFSASKGDVLYLFEVKNLRLPVNLIELIDRILTDRFSQNPELYSLSFYIDLMFEGSATVAPSEQDEVEIARFCDHLHTAILSGNRKVTWSSTALLGLTTAPKKIGCKWSKSEYYNTCFHSRDFQMASGQYPAPHDLVLALKRKTERIIEAAYFQLVEYDHENAAVKVILLNWEKPAHFRFDHNLESQYLPILNQFNLSLAEGNPPASVRLLD